jgi:hypothetical protein
LKDLTRRGFVKISSMVGAVFAGAATGKIGAQSTGFQAAGGPDGPGGPGGMAKKGPGIQSIYALCEVTGGGQKVYGIAVEYDAVIDPASLDLGTYTASVYPVARGGGPGMMGGPGMPQNSTMPATTPNAQGRPLVDI